MKIIKLKFDNTLTIISGSDYGEEVFNEQVKNEIDYKSMNEIDFGSNIQIIGISFVQGFTKEIFTHIDKSDFSKHFVIKGTDKAVQKFMKAVRY